MKNYKRKPSERQKKLAESIVQNFKGSEKKPLGLLMRQAGYSVSQSKNPAQIVKSESFKSLMLKSGISEAELGEVWAKLLRAEIDETKPMSWKDKIQTAKEMSKFYFPEGSSTRNTEKEKFFAKVQSLMMTPEEEAEEDERIRKQEEEIQERIRREERGEIIEENNSSLKDN